MPTRLRTLAALATLLALGSPLLAQTRPAPFDIEPLLARLEKPATHDAAVAAIPTLPESALEPLYQASKDKTLSPDVRRDIADALPALHQRIITDRNHTLRAIDQKWGLDTGLVIYQKSGHHDPRWDDSVVHAFTSIPAGNPDAFQYIKAAIDAGCDDPLVRYFYASRAPATALDFAARITLLNAVINDLIKSPYPRERVIYARLLYLDLVDNPANQAAFQQALAKPHPAGQPPLVSAGVMFDQALVDLPHVDPKLNTGSATQIAREIADAAAVVGKGIAGRRFDTTYGALHAAFPHNAYVESYAAETLTLLAWDARGGGWASSVTDDGWKLFAQRLDDAEKHALASVAIDPASSDGPTAMLTICMGKSYDNDTLKYWFARAVNGALYNTAACDRAVMALLPKWGGSEPEVLAFARDVVRHRGGRLPLALVFARQDLADDSGDPGSYLKNPEVWADINAAYETVIASDEKDKSPGLAFDRAQYLRYAARCEQWSDFLALDARFGKDIDVEAFGGQAMLTFYRKKAAAAPQ